MVALEERCPVMLSGACSSLKKVRIFVGLVPGLSARIAVRRGRGKIAVAVAFLGKTSFPVAVALCDVARRTLCVVNRSVTFLVAMTVCAGEKGSHPRGRRPRVVAFVVVLSVGHCVSLLLEVEDVSGAL